MPMAISPVPPATTAPGSSPSAPAYAVTPSAASARRTAPNSRARAPGSSARNCPPSVAIPAAPTHTALSGPPSAASWPEPESAASVAASVRSSRAAGTSCSSMCPASMPSVPVRTGSADVRVPTACGGAPRRTTASVIAQPRSAGVGGEHQRRTRVTVRGGAAVRAVLRPVHGSRRSTGSAACRASRSLTRLKEREPNRRAGRPGPSSVPRKTSSRLWWSGTSTGQNKCSSFPATGCAICAADSKSPGRFEDLEEEE